MRSWRTPPLTSNYCMAPTPCLDHEAVSVLKPKGFRTGKNDTSLPMEMPNWSEREDGSSAAVTDPEGRSSHCPLEIGHMLVCHDLVTPSGDDRLDSRRRQEGAVMRASVQLLGPVQLRVRDELVDLRGARQQRLLAVLALQVTGRWCPPTALIDAVWAEGELPPDPRSTLRTYLSRLRHSFDDAHAIESRDGGYCLSIAETVVDSATFEAYLSDADRVSLPARRADLLGAALDLWNGPALDGLAHEPWARPEAARLDELRAVSLERRAEALLDDGQVDLAISELQGAVCTYPHREALVALLMSALDRRGRRAEALRAYNEYWHRLATDVGLEPGEDIVGLERRIAAGGAADPVRCAAPRLRIG